MKMLKQQIKLKYGDIKMFSMNLELTFNLRLNLKAYIKKKIQIVNK